MQSERPGFRVVSGSPCDWNDAEADELLLVCPWLNGLDPATGLWLAVLPIHDCNRFLDSDWQLNAPAHLRERCYVGVFTLDRLRSSRQILGPLGEKGVGGLINLPSIGFFDGRTAQTFQRLGFSLESESAFLSEARGAGFGTGLCAREGEPVSPSLRFDFVLRHGGPDEPLRLQDRPRPSRPAIHLM